MSNLFIVKASHVPGPQATTAPTEQKNQITYAVGSLNYAATLQTATAPTEPNKMGVSYAIVSLNYA